MGPSSIGGEYSPIYSISTSSQISLSINEFYHQPDSYVGPAPHPLRRAPNLRQHHQHYGSLRWELRSIPQKSHRPVTPILRRSLQLHRCHRPRHWASTRKTSVPLVRYADMIHLKFHGQDNIYLYCPLGLISLVIPCIVHLLAYIFSTYTFFRVPFSFIEVPFALPYRCIKI